jgi:hypothetical protein
MMPRPVIASEAKQSMVPRRKSGLLFAPLHKRFAFVAGNDEMFGSK